MLDHDSYMILDQRGIDVGEDLSMAETRRRLNQLPFINHLRVKPDKDWAHDGWKARRWINKANNTDENQ